METNQVMTLVIAFIVVSIILSLGVSILGSAGDNFDCDDLEGWTGSSTNATDWSKACLEIQDQQQSSFNLLIIILVVIAAVAILVVVKMLY